MTTWFRRTPEAEALVAEERLVLAATEMVHEALETTGTTKRKLAEKLGVRPTEISQRLSGRRNLTLRSLAQMMNALGYDVKLEAIKPVDMDAADAHIGKRVHKRITEGPAVPHRVWGIAVHVAIRGDTKSTRDLATSRVNKVIDELRTLDRIRRATADNPKGTVFLIHIGVEAEDLLDASLIGLSALRTAIHTIGDGTPGWEKMFDRAVQDLQIKVDSADESDEPTSCT